MRWVGFVVFGHVSVFVSRTEYLVTNKTYPILIRVLAIYTFVLTLECIIDN